VSCDGEVEAALERARGRFGRMDVVVANAGFGVAGTLNELELDDYRRQLEVNVFGVLRTVYAALPDLKKARGRLAILGSINGYLMLPGGSRMR
jgi:NAD(P)-dependent dehydrogenase (short-subunit alcohol dehydrogenase family)